MWPPCYSDRLDTPTQFEVSEVLSNHAFLLAPGFHCVCPWSYFACLLNSWRAKLPWKLAWKEVILLFWLPDLLLNDVYFIHKFRVRIRLIIGSAEAAFCGCEMSLLMLFCAVIVVIDFMPSLPCEEQLKFCILYLRSATVSTSSQFCYFLCEFPTHGVVSTYRAPPGLAMVVVATLVVFVCSPKPSAKN